MNPISDFDQPATKKDIKEVRTELTNVKSALWNQSLRTEEKVEKLEETINYNTVQLIKINKQLNRLGIILDQFVGNQK